MTECEEKVPFYTHFDKLFQSASKLSVMRNEWVSARRLATGIRNSMVWSGLVSPLGLMMSDEWEESSDLAVRIVLIATETFVRCFTGLLQVLDLLLNITFR